MTTLEKILKSCKNDHKDYHKTKNLLEYLRLHIISYKLSHIFSSDFFQEFGAIKKQFKMPLCQKCAREYFKNEYTLQSRFRNQFPILAMDNLETEFDKKIEINYQHKFPTFEDIVKDSDDCKNFFEQEKLGKILEKNGFRKLRVKRFRSIKKLFPKKKPEINFGTKKIKKTKIFISNYLYYKNLILRKMFDEFVKISPNFIFSREANLKDILKKCESIENEKKDNYNYKFEFRTNKLPFEIVLSIIEYSDYKELFKMGTTCHYLHNFIFGDKSKYLVIFFNLLAQSICDRNKATFDENKLKKMCGYKKKERKMFNDVTSQFYNTVKNTNDGGTTNSCRLLFNIPKYKQIYSPKYISNKQRIKNKHCELDFVIKNLRKCFDKLNLDKKMINMMEVQLLEAR